MSINSLYTHYMVDLTDPRTREWPLTSPLSVILIITIYLYGVLKAGPNYMRNRKSFNLKRIIQVYNLFQVFSCCLLIYKFIINGWTNHYIFECYLVDYSNNPMATNVAALFWWTMMLKLCELIETVFFVLRKKHNQISGLHLYHHVSTYIAIWLGTNYVPGGLAMVPIILNSFIHVLMYTYYFLSTLGPTWQKSLAKWKPKLTILQMIQFCLLLLYTTIIFQEGCDFPKFAAYVFVPNVLLVFYMFYDFYQKCYCIDSTKTN